ncbi:RHS repeat domain-containing protein [Calditrichota bacterium LG25]
MQASFKKSICTSPNGYKSPDVYGQKHLRGRLSYKAYKNHGDWDYTYYSYTRDGKIEWIEHHIQGLRKRIEYEYDLAGNIVKISYDRNGPDQLFYWYEYGPTGSLISVYTNTTDDRATAQKEITYLATDQFGNQTQIILGYNVQAVDTIEYVYDIWNNLLSINDVNDLGNDKFAMKLFYNSNDFEQKYYNGLISGIELHYPAISGVNENRYRYGFEYDPLNRLKNAQHYWPEYEGPENPGVISAWIGDEKYKVNNLLYDANGNIKSLRRNNDNGTILNDLQYSYATNTNKLTSVTDGSLTKTFGYDASGNVIKYNAGNDHLYEIEYNFRNLPIQIQTTGPDGEPLFYYYAYDDGAGRIYDKEDNLITAYYIRGADGQVMAEYNYQKNLVLWRMGGFGYKTPDGNSYYYLKDHIGNIRVTVNEQGEIVTKDDYYPFGLRMPGLSYNNGNQNDRLKFQSKKLQDYGNWRTYYFGWRDYDPELGRWFVVDPARQFASPYVAMANNPIIGYDEDGAFAWFIWVGMLAGAYLGGAAAQEHFELNPGKWENSWSTYFGIIAGGIAGALTANAIAGSYGLEIGLNGYKIFTLGGDAIGAGAGSVIGGGSGYIVNQVAGDIDSENSESTESSKNFFDDYRRYKNMLNLITPGKSKYWYVDETNPNYWMERWQGKPYGISDGNGDKWDCSYTCSQAYIMSGIVPKGTRWTTTSLFGPMGGDRVNGWLSQNPADWGEFTLIGWKYYNDKGELEGHMGIWTNNYRGQPGFWHNSAFHGKLQFDPYGGYVWNYYIKMFGKPWGYIWHQ